ncbi:MAG: geranylgeranylglycerol-phosphate geranylgeranyltransferase, partial [Bacteroidota bacterium]
ANQHTLTFFSEKSFWATALTIAIIAAAGYWINDVYDFRIDRINKPKRTIVNAILSVKKVLTAYFLTNMAILLFSVSYLGFFSKFYQITFINFLSVIMLFIYASYLKRVSVAGNLVVSFLTTLVVILAGYLYQVNLPLIWAGIFAFEITFIREITKDIEDIKGDLSFNLHTLPIQIGIQRTKYILLALYILFILSSYLPFAIHAWRTDQFLWTYLILSILLVQLPMLWLVRKMWQANEPADFSRQSQGLKFLILAGMLTLFFL